MDPLGDLLTTRPMQKGWEISIEPCPNQRCWWIDNPDVQFANGLVPTRTLTKCHGPEPLLIVIVRIWRECLVHAAAGSEDISEGIIVVFSWSNITSGLLDLISHWVYSGMIWLVLATGLGDAAAVRIWTGKMVWFGSRNVQDPSLLLLGGPNLAPDASTLGFCRVWQDSMGPISGFAFWVALFMVAFRYPTVDHHIITMIR